ncbi:GntR family transcriptional regulator [Kaistia dalseonensis]|uniref:DNA-binding GntR family transcriptional regulator n=1 Tax=Kaistia dalseonensis TaxID=410840 RepID=A0ABU0HB67_9HYPH|nr:GntR family transcriptional regulator [Kaistia dalseonensis]MCX5496140.1 GntR family transcriptional regulator [Kaistia dalseonensis]MDQ0438749.1 DNA-binding GntR family transcriptional regulator [Kaistia dalseonensis]
MSLPAPLASSGDTETDSLEIEFHLDRKRPVADQVYEALKAAIVSVRLLPGTSISENRMCRHFGVSRTPVRSAIVRLADEGLIDVYPQQGSFVAPIRLADVYDRHFIRKHLELAVLAEVAKRWTAAKSAEARAIVATQVAAIEVGDPALFHERDEALHAAFAVFAEREGIWPTIQMAKARMSRLHRLFGPPERLPVVVEEHLSVLDALDAGDAALAHQRLEYHLDKIFETFDPMPEAYRPYLAD